MVDKAANGVLFTQPCMTERETRAVAATTPPDDDDEISFSFGDAAVDRAFINLMGNALAADREKRRAEVTEEFFAFETQRLKAGEEVDRQINALRVEVAELRGQLAQVNQRERGPAGPRGEHGHKGPAGRPGRKGDPGLTPRVPTIKGWLIDKRRYVVTPVMSDHSVGPSIKLMDLFEEYNKATTT
jgi:hypothetical protein